MEKIEREKQEDYMNEIISKLRIRYKDLTIPLKIAVIMAWILGIMNALFFLYGFFIEMNTLN